MVAVVAAFQDAGGELVIHNLKLSRIQDLRMAARSVGGQDYARPGSASHPSDGDDRPLVRTRRCSFHRRLIMNSPPTGELLTIELHFIDNNDKAKPA